MHKGESVISIVITVLVVLVFLAVQKQWSPAALENMASTAEEFVLKTAGLRGDIPELPGYKIVRTFWLGNFRAALYRASPASLVFASYRFVIFDRKNRPVYKVDSVETSASPWTTLYDFAGLHGRIDPKTGGYPNYRRDLTGDGRPDVLLGQYSGGSHCCTRVTVFELEQNTAKIIGRIDGLDGMPFEGLTILKLGRGRGSELVAHRPYETACGMQEDAADVIAVYAYRDGKFADSTSQFTSYLHRVLQRHLDEWKITKNRSFHLLQTIATDFSATGQTAAGEQFFQNNLPQFSSELQANGIDPKVCAQNMSTLLSLLALNSAQK